METSLDISEEQTRGGRSGREVGVTVATEPPSLGDAHPVWAMSTKCPGTREMDVQCGQCPQVSRLQRGPGAPQATRPSRGENWGECSRLHVDLQPCPYKGRQPRPPACRPRTHTAYLRQAAAPTARALTVLDDRDVDRRGASHGHKRLLGGHTEDFGDCSPQPAAVPTRASAVLSIGPRDPSCSCAVQSAVDSAHALPLSQ